MYVQITIPDKSNKPIFEQRIELPPLEKIFGTDSSITYRVSVALAQKFSGHCKGYKFKLYNMFFAGQLHIIMKQYYPTEEDISFNMDIITILDNGYEIFYPDLGTDRVKIEIKH